MGYRFHTRTRLLGLLLLLLFGRGVQAQAPSCTSTLYVKKLEVGLPVASMLLPLPGGGTIFGGQAWGTISNVSVVKAAPDGSIVLNRQIIFPRYSNLTRGALTPGNRVVVAHASTLALLDTNSVILKATTVNLSFGQLELLDLKVDAAGNVVVLYRNIANTANGYDLVKLSADLTTLLWTRHLGEGNADFHHLAVIGDRVFTLGRTRGHANDEDDGTLLSFDGATGQLEKQVSYRLDGFATNPNTLHPLPGGYLLEGFYQPNSTPYAITSHAVLRLDTALQPVRAVRLTGLLNSEPLFVSPDEHGGYYGMRGSLGYYFYCNARDSVLWSRSAWQFASVGMDNFARTATNLYSLEDNCRALYKADLNGRIGGCKEYTESFTTVALQPDTVVKPPVPISTTALALADISLPVVDQPSGAVDACRSTSLCSTLAISGPAAVCTAGEAVLFKGRRNDGCRLPVAWEVKGGPVVRDQLNDSTLSVHFLQSGTYQLVARLADHCAVAADTLTVSVTLSQLPPLSLGPDQELCAGNTLTLTAPAGYTSYRWQDGTTDTSFVVAQPGLYYVAATACGTTYTDSVRITAAAPIALDLGADRTRCNDDTLHLDAPPGFSSYTWGNDYHISSLTAQTVIVRPPTDTAYWVRAERSPGCAASDTVRVRVRHSPPIDLGADRQFCQGDSAVLRAASGFVTYRWSTGDTGPLLTVKDRGRYAVTGTTGEGCTRSDTVEVMAVYPLPVVALDKNPSLCAGDSRPLDAGPFAAYRWQDGSGDRTFLASDTGQYTVTVTDHHGCRGSDTVAITTLHPQPQGFLPPDTVLCTYGKLQLQAAAPYTTYRWSTGAATPSLTISRPGLYWLEVRDAHHCTGTDSLTVYPKDCGRGLYVPTAFTPNRDGRNDVFCPLVLGEVVSFVFTVYNRWGQVVFRTTEPGKGWNGQLGGHDQDEGVFVWTCTYRFEGEAPKSEKGTVLLVK